MLPNFKKSEPEAGKTPAMPPSPTAIGTAQPPRPAPPALRASGANAPSAIGPDLIITGNLVSKGEMQIDGEVQGDIRGTNIIIGERAKITGTVIAEETVIRGQVMGSVRSRRVMLQTSSRVEGDIYHQSLAIEQGAYFEGKSRRSDDPLAGTTTSAAPVATPETVPGT